MQRHLIAGLTYASPTPARAAEFGITGPSAAVAKTTGKRQNLPITVGRLPDAESRQARASHLEALRITRPASRAPSAAPTVTGRLPCAPRLAKTWLHRLLIAWGSVDA